MARGEILRLARVAALSSDRVISKEEGVQRERLKYVLSHGPRKLGREHRQ
jgi:hypothetical protein